MPLNAKKTAFSAICFMNGRVEPRKTTEDREFKEKDLQRSISGIEPAYHKYELEERDRDKYSMDGEKAFSKK